MYAKFGLFKVNCTTRELQGVELGAYDCVLFDRIYIHSGAKYFARRLSLSVCMSELRKYVCMHVCFVCKARFACGELHKSCVVGRLSLVQTVVSCLFVGSHMVLLHSSCALSVAMHTNLNNERFHVTPATGATC